MTNKEHNGWYNYETWAVNLWMDNDESSQKGWFELAGQLLGKAQAAKERDELKSFTPEERAALDLADKIKDAHEESLPDLDAGFVVDLLNAAMSEVNWMEIAKW